MHELALADAAVAICRRHADGRPVARVGVEVGALRQVVPDAFRFAFELLAEGTELAGAELEIVQVPTRVACRACDEETELATLPLACPRCGWPDIDVVAGEECHVAWLEIDQPVPAGGR